MTKVLVVDDEPQIRRAMRTSLQANRFDVRTVGTGEEAVVAAAAEAPDIVLLDLGLPDLDGAEVIRRVRSFSDVPIIVVSVRDRQADKVAALDAGADDYVTKRVWGPRYQAESHYLRVYVRSLRRKLGDQAAAPRLILTEPGMGYRWIAKP